MRWCRLCSERTYVGSGWCLNGACRREQDRGRWREGRSRDEGSVGRYTERRREGGERTTASEGETGATYSVRCAEPECEPVSHGMQGQERRGTERRYGGKGSGPVNSEYGHEDGVDDHTEPRGRVQVEGHRIWDSFVEVTGLAQVRRIILLDNNGVLNRLGWEQAVKVGVDLEHATDHAGGETCLLMCSYARSDTWVQRVMDSPETRPMMRSLDGFVFVDSREMRGGPILVQRVTGRPENWIRLVGGDKSAISRLTGKPTMLFDDKWKVLRAHQRGHASNEGVLCVPRGRSSRRRRELGDGRGRYGFWTTSDPETWVEYVEWFLNVEDCEERRAETSSDN